MWLCMTRRHVLQLSKPRLEFIASLGYKSYLIEVRRRRASLLTRATYSTYPRHRRENMKVDGGRNCHSVSYTDQGLTHAQAL